MLQEFLFTCMDFVLMGAYALAGGALVFGIWLLLPRRLKDKINKKLFEDN